MCMTASQWIGVALLLRLSETHFVPLGNFCSLLTAECCKLFTALDVIVLVSFTQLAVLTLPPVSASNPFSFLIELAGVVYFPDEMQQVICLTIHRRCCCYSTTSASNVWIE